MPRLLRRAAGHDGDRAGEAATLNNMAAVYDATGRPAEALALFRAGLTHSAGASTAEQYEDYLQQLRGAAGGG